MQIIKIKKRERKSKMQKNHNTTKISATLNPSALLKKKKLLKQAINNK